MHRAASGRAGRALIALAVLLTLIVPIAGNPTGTSQPHRAAAQSADATAEVPSGDVIVVLNPDAPAAEVVAADVSEDVLGEIEPEVVFTSVIDGFAADVTPEQAEQLADDPRVAGVFPNNPVYQASQEVPTGVRRSGADTNDIANINGLDQRVNADVAVLDSGIDGSTGDLDLVGGVDCSESGNYGDGSGHGTHVAGIIGALDNNIGVVGVAPGARLWSVRVLQGTTGTDAFVICGLDWVYANRATIDVVNMSLVGTGSDVPCTRNPATTLSPLHEAVCRVTDAGIPIVAAAGNEGRDVAANNGTTIRPVTPAIYDEVITVSSLTDFDGLPGGLGSKPSGCMTTSTQDDRFSTQSNFGADVDIMAPGTCIRSTAPGGGTVYRSGTSMAAPHVTGAIALYLSQNGGTTIESVRGWLNGQAIGQSAPGGILGGDPDGVAEPLLWVGLGSVPFATPTPTPTPEATITPPANAYRLIFSDRSVNSAASKYVRDNKLSTVWSTKSAMNPPTSAFVWVEMETLAPVGSIRWVFGESGIADRFWIETSTDLVTWTRIAKRTNKPVGVWQEVAVSSIDAKYVRFRFDNPKLDPRLGGIAEIQVWAPGAPALNPTPTPTVTPIPVKYVLNSGGRTLNSVGHTYTWDGDPQTFWRTTSVSIPTSGSFFVNLGTQRSIGAVRWMFTTEGNADLMRIDISWDCKTWTNVATRTNAPLFEWQEQVINLDGRCVRWLFENPNSDAVLGGIGEVEIWSRAGGPLTDFPSLTPTATASATPTETPTPTATPTLTGSETPTPTPTPTEEVGGAEEGGAPEVTPVASPEATEEPAVTSEPIIEPTATPEPTSTAEPTQTPEPTATPEPIEQPAEEPTEPIAPAEVIEPAPTVEVVEVVETPQPYEPRRVRQSANALDGDLVIDRDLGTIWTTDGTSLPDDAYVLIDLGRAQSVSVVRWWFGAPELAAAYVVEVSSDRRTWTEVARGGYPEGGVWIDVPIWEEIRFVRLSFTNPNGDVVIGGLAEVEIWP